MNTVWVITEERNAYDQYGEYFIQAYAEKPTHQQCLEFLLSVDYVNCTQDKKHQDKMAAFLMKGGGRYKDTEDVWYWLREEELK